MGFAELLTIVFVVLKILGKIDWSWWLVCLPEIIAVVFYMIVFLASLRLHSMTVRSIRKRSRKF